MKSNFKMAIISIAITMASASSAIAGAGAIQVQDISCQEGTKNVEAIQDTVAPVNTYTTRRWIEQTIAENSGEKKDKGGVIESSKTIRFMIATSGAADSFCRNGDKSTYLIVTTSKEN